MAKARSGRVRRAMREPFRRWGKSKRMTSLGFFWAIFSCGFELVSSYKFESRNADVQWNHRIVPQIEVKIYHLFKTFQNRMVSLCDTQNV